MCFPPIVPELLRQPMPDCNGIGGRSSSGLKSQVAPTLTARHPTAVDSHSWPGRGYGTRTILPFKLIPTAIKNDRWHESFLARRRPPTRRAIPTAETVRRVNDFGG